MKPHSHAGQSTPQTAPGGHTTSSAPAVGGEHLSPTCSHFRQLSEQSHQVRPERTQSLTSTQVFPLNGISELLRYHLTASQSWVLPLCRYLMIKEVNSGWVMSTALTEPLHLFTQQGTGPSHLKTDCETTHTNGCHLQLLICITQDFCHCAIKMKNTTVWMLRLM